MPPAPIVWCLSPSHVSVELEPPPGDPDAAVELEVVITAWGRALAVWHLSQTGAVLAVGWAGLA